MKLQRIFCAVLGAFSAPVENPSTTKSKWEFQCVIMQVGKRLFRSATVKERFAYNSLN